MSHARVIGAIVRKDAVQLTRDRFFTVITILALGAYVALFWSLPATVDETIHLGVHGPSVTSLLNALGSDEGLDLRVFASSDDLRAAVEEKQDDIAAGIDFPDDFLEAVAAGRRTSVTVYVPADTPPEIREAMRSMVRELSYLVAGNQPPVTAPAEEEVVLGVDRAGNQISIRERMRPLLGVFVLLVELLSLAALIAEEIRSRTVTAVVATPATVSDFLAAKSIFGTLLAFAEVALLMVAVKGLSERPLEMLTALLLGAILVTGLALLAGATGKDFVEILFWSMMLMIPLMIPAGAALFPGTASGWVKVMPSYGMTEAIFRAGTYGAGWSEIWPFLALSAAWSVVVFGLGVAVLRRKVQSL